MKIYNNGLIIKDISNQINWDKAVSSYRFAFRYEKLLLYYGDMIIFMKIQILLEMVSQYQNVVLIVLQFLI